MAAREPSRANHVVMAKIEGLTKVIEQLRSRAAKSRKGDDVSVSVGYTAAYALYVHENLTAHHPVGQAKYLEQPARQNAREYGEIVRQAKQKGRTTAQALLLAGLRLQRDSQKIVPVDTGALKGSAFTRLDPKGST